MKTRKMWAEQRVFDGGGNVLCFEHDRTPLGIHQPRTPVLVTDATDMPDFEPGDRVRQKGRSIYTVYDSPWYSRDGWRVPLSSLEGGPYSMSLRAEDLTKIPREKTVTLRVTGPESSIDTVVAQVCEDYRGVRVERVEDPDE